jgi:glycosyltransferase involved in cell wall biosynthesis
MNLLVITNNPRRASFRQRIEAYFDILRDSGIGCEVGKLPTGIWRRGTFLKQAAHFDGVLLHKKGLNLVDAFWLRKYAKKVIYNFDDAVMYSEKKPERDNTRHFRAWRRTVKIADMVITGSPYLAECAQRFNGNVKVLPIGIKVSDYSTDRPVESDGKVRLVWIGSKSTLHYLLQIRAVLEEIGARFGDVILRVISDDFPDLEKMPVEKRLWSVLTRGVELATSDIGLAPLPEDRFTKGKCSFKVLEYAAAGLPAVASPVGTNTQHVCDDITGFLAANKQEWFEKICRLVKDRQLRKKMGGAAREYAKNFDISLIGKQFVELIADCLRDSSYEV